MCTGPVTTAAIAKTAATATSGRGTGDTTAVLDEVAEVAVYAVIGDAIIDGCGAATGVIVHVALGGPPELLRAVEARNVARAVQVVQFDGCGVDCLSVARGIVIVVHRGRRWFLEHRQERRVHHARPADAHSEGGNAIGAWRAESWAAGEGGKVGAL